MDNDKAKTTKEYFGALRDGLVTGALLAAVVLPAGVILGVVSNALKPKA